MRNGSRFNLHLWGCTSAGFPMNLGCARATSSDQRRPNPPPTRRGSRPCRPRSMPGALWSRLLIAVGLFALALFGSASARRAHHLGMGRRGRARALLLAAGRAARPEPAPGGREAPHRHRAAGQAARRRARGVRARQGQMGAVRGGADRDGAAVAPGRRARGRHPARRLRRDRTRPAEHGDRARLGTARAAGGHRPRPDPGPGGRRAAQRRRPGRHLRPGLRTADRPGRDAAAQRAHRGADRVPGG